MHTYSETEFEKLHPTTRYAVEIALGLRISCKREKQACERHLNDLERQGTKDFPFVFDKSRANRIFDWDGICRHVRGPFSGQPIQLLDFQKFDNGCIFGWVHKDTGRRRFRKVFIMRARGNVKSTEMSCNALYGMCGDCIYPPGKPELKRYEESPEVECAAVDRDQAKRIWGDAKKIGINSPDISNRLELKRTYIEHKTRGGWLRPLSKDTKNKDSGAPCMVIIDEYHGHPTSEIHDILFSGFGKRQQALMIIISTAGKDAENNPCKKEYDTCCKILDGIIPNDDYFIIIRELDENDDPHDENIRVKANPVLQEDNEYSRILREQIRAEHDLAYGSGDPDKIREFLIKRCNFWQTGSEEKYMTEDGMKKWKSLAIPREKFLRLVRGKPCYNGEDLSKCIDLTASGFVFPLDDGRYAVTVHGFMPENTATRHEHEDQVPYKAWAGQGWCTLTEGDVTDDTFIKNYIHQQEQKEQWKIEEICYDPYGARQFANDMTAQGYECIEIRQGVATLSEPTKRFRELILQGKIVHDGNPILTWCLSNAYEITDINDNARLTKKSKTATQRIDLLTAIINAMVRVIVRQPKSSIYEDANARPEGILVI